MGAEKKSVVAAVVAAVVVAAVAVVVMVVVAEALSATVKVEKDARHKAASVANTNHAASPKGTSRAGARPAGLVLLTAIGPNVIDVIGDVSEVPAAPRSDSDLFDANTCTVPSRIPASSKKRRDFRVPSPPPPHPALDLVSNSDSGIRAPTPSVVSATGRVIIVEETVDGVGEVVVNASSSAAAAAATAAVVVTASCDTLATCFLLAAPSDEKISSILLPLPSQEDGDAGDAPVVACLGKVNIITCAACVPAANALSHGPPANSGHARHDMGAVARKTCKT